MREFTILSDSGQRPISLQASRSILAFMAFGNDAHEAYGEDTELGFMVFWSVTPPAPIVMELVSFLQQAGFSGKPYKGGMEYYRQLNRFVERVVIEGNTVDVFIFPELKEKPMSGLDLTYKAGRQLIGMRGDTVSRTDSAYSSYYNDSGSSDSPSSSGGCD